MELIKVSDFYGEEDSTVEITKNWYAGFQGQLKSIEGDWEFSWHQVDWYEFQEFPVSNSHLGVCLMISEDCNTREKAIEEGILMLTRYLIVGLEQLGADDQMSLVDLKQEY